MEPDDDDFCTYCEGISYIGEDELPCPVCWPLEYDGLPVPLPSPDEFVALVTGETPTETEEDRT